MLEKTLQSPLDCKEIQPVHPKGDQSWVFIPLVPDSSISLSQLYAFCIRLHKNIAWWLSGKESACNAGDLGSIPGSGRSPGEGIGNPLQYSCLENPMDRGAWWATIHRIAQSWTRLK